MFFFKSFCYTNIPYAFHYFQMIYIYIYIYLINFKEKLHLKSNLLSQLCPKPNTNTSFTISVQNLCILRTCPCHPQDFDSTQVNMLPLYIYVKMAFQEWLTFSKCRSDQFHKTRF